MTHIVSTPNLSPEKSFNVIFYTCRFESHIASKCHCDIEVFLAMHKVPKGMIRVRGHKV